MKRRGFLALLAAVPLALFGASESSRYRGMVRKIVSAWDYGAKPPEIWATLTLKDDLSAGIQAANKSLARIRVEFVKSERAFRIFHEDLEAMTGRLTKSVEALR
jgi:hypothetical protein